jgi:hypothetical protein
MKHFGTIVATVLLGGGILTSLPGGCARSASGDEVPSVLPRPHHVKTSGKAHRLAPSGQAVRFVVKGLDPDTSASLREAQRVLAGQVVALGGPAPRPADHPDQAQLVFERVAPEELAALLETAGLEEAATESQVQQAYRLEAKPHGVGARVRIQAAGDLGLYYGTLTLVQMLQQSTEGHLTVPGAEITDWPEVGRRLAKLRAVSELEMLREATAWFGLYRFNLTALHYFSPPAKRPKPLLFDNVRRTAADCQERGTPELIVYYCPFADSKVTLDQTKRDWTGVFDFTQAEDREQYVELIGRLMDLGARGIQVDYNDLPDRADGAPVDDVINLAYKAAREKDPKAYVLYCPSVVGQPRYFGPASDRMRDVLSRVPDDVWVLWTGPNVRMTESKCAAQHNYKGPLKPEDIRAWTEKAGRRPFFWLNRVTPRDKHGMQFALPCPGDGAYSVFRGQWLPDNLGSLVEGVHLNQVFDYRKPDDKELVYLATAADFLWNPEGWDPADSCRRAKTFVQRMKGLVADWVMCAKCSNRAAHWVRGRLGPARSRRPVAATAAASRASGGPAPGDLGHLTRHDDKTVQVKRL